VPVKQGAASAVVDEGVGVLKSEPDLSGNRHRGLKGQGARLHNQLRETGTRWPLADRENHTIFDATSEGLTDCRVAKVSRALQVAKELIQRCGGTAPHWRSHNTHHHLSGQATLRGALCKKHTSPGPLGQQLSESQLTKGQREIRC